MKGLKEDLVTLLRSVVGILSVAACLAGSTAPVRAQKAIPLIRQMVGTWDVTERMWPGLGMAPMALPAATAQRRLVGDALLQETMVAAPGSNQPFTRVASFDYNAVTHQYEYFSWDTRGPQMMTEKSHATAMNERSAISLEGGTFIAPQWGRTRNAVFRYRLALGQIQNGRQFVRLYFTPQSGSLPREFLAFEYVYTKRR